MPGGKYDSSKTRVRPVFDTLWARGRDWLPQLLSLPSGGCRGVSGRSGDLALLEGYWEPNEKGLDPPVSLLSWLIRNIGGCAGAQFESSERRRLAAGDPAMVAEALTRLRSRTRSKAWHLFEGQTRPDVFLAASDALVVIEGKRTEAGVTSRTKWLPGRHQMWRHLDAAWEIRGRRAVYGFFIVESEHDSTDAAVPEHWRVAVQECMAPNVLRSSFPHRSSEEADAIAGCFLGATTWRHVCEQFAIDWRGLPIQV